MTLTVVILTFNEEQHIARAIKSVKRISHSIIVIDSGSRDDTIKISEEHGAEVLFNPFLSHAKQLNWALENLPPDTDWVLRLDADEVVSDELADEISKRLLDLPPEIVGATLPRRIAFMGRPIRHGGVFPVHVLRLFRYGCGKCEDRWMDEHIEVDGKIISLKGELLDDNLKPIGWWIDKHNAYASREALELLDTEYGILARRKASRLGRSQTGMKRWIKENIYLRLPGGFRALAYFIYRFVLRLGFLDGRSGAAFHVLQGFWYRYLVDIKKYEVERYIRQNGCDIYQAVDEVLGIEISGPYRSKYSISGVPLPDDSGQL